MKRALLSLALIALMAIPVLGAQNPNIRIYLDVDPPNKIHRIDPAASASFDVYVCLDCFGTQGGTRGTAFLIERTFTGYKLAQAALLGGLDFGDVEVDGWTIAAGTDCVYPDDSGVVCVGRITYLFLGGAGTATLAPHPGTGRQVLDCDFQEDDLYCIYANLGVGVDPLPGEDGCDCEPPQPVEDSTWGGIKSLYR
jgi:hypothetical protein